MRDLSKSLHLLSINAATLRQWPIDRIVAECGRRGVGAVTPWRDQVRPLGAAAVGRLLRDAGVTCFGYCRGGMFTDATAAGRARALDDNRRALDEAAELGASHLVLVVGGLPGGMAGRLDGKSLSGARSQVVDAVGRLLDDARATGVSLALEPLHPMYAADRSCLNTLGQALDLCDIVDPDGSGAIGVALDVYHVWWDPELEAQIARAGRRILAFHVCDWLLHTRDLLNDRGMMGDGVIDIPAIRGWVEATGYAGFNEVEIFSTLDWQTRDGDEVLDTCIRRHASAV
jgi:sugar phosphate isomerase/epimerase